MTPPERRPPPSTQEVIRAKIDAHRFEMSRRTAVTASALAALGIVVGDVGGLLPGTPGASAIGPWGGHSNGRIPASALTSVPAGTGPFLRSDAAAAYFQFNDAFRARFGKNLGITEAYRSYDRQVYLYDQYLNNGGNLAARPGTSEHGWAQACDFGTRVDRYGTPEKIWADANGPRFGWSPTGNTFSRKEPWHFDYLAGAYTPPAGPLLNEKDGEMSYTIRNTATGDIYTVAAQFIKHEPSTLSAQTTANVTTPDDQIVGLEAASFGYFLDSMGVPRNVLPKNGGIWSRETEILAKLDQILAKG
jgi:hypothetical protein